MKNTILSIILISSFSFIGCNTNKTAHTNETKTSQKLEHKSINGMLMGQISPQDLQVGSYADWYEENYKYHNLNQPLINDFKEDLNQYQIQVFMGTWCGDSQRETPAFFRILENADFPKDQVNLFAVNRDKLTGVNAEKGKNISHVPTFIFYKDGKEVGRIVESPINSLEEDIQDIVNGTPQTPNYAD